MNCPFCKKPLHKNPNLNYFNNICTNCPYKYRAWLDNNMQEGWEFRAGKYYVYVFIWSDGYCLTKIYLQNSSMLFCRNMILQPCSEERIKIILSFS